MRDFPKKAWVYTGAIAVVATFLVFFLLSRQHGPHLRTALGFGLLFILAELAPFKMKNGSYSVGFVVAVAAIVTIGPAEAAIAASFGALDLSLRNRPDWLGRFFFNAAQVTVATGLAGAVYRALGGPVGRVGASNFPFIFIPLFAAALVYFIANTGLVAGMISLMRNVGLKEAWHAHYAPMVANTLAFAVIGVLLGMLSLQMGLAGVLFLLVPMMVVRHALQAAAEMDAAYEATLRGLVTAIEAKDAYTRGHAERVSKLTTLIARELGFSEKAVHSIRIAALMHDVGKLVVSTAILTKPGKLTDEEYEHMKWHPIFGCEVIEEIDFLRDGEAVNAVRHHHERLDGRGYPDNLFGDDVPLTARVVMVADAFDSMTSTRTYRFAKSVDDGLRELRRCAATQFDPLCISALDRAIHKHGWEPTPELYGGEQTERPAVSVHAEHA
jgi:HD-GYP domain-containing protein (c-di-GMP phosphodiesterase class II)